MKITHISDIHLTEHGQVIWDTDTLSHFESAIQVLSKIKDLDAVIVSGDLSNDGSEWTYHYIDERLATLKLPVFCCLGNHDSTSALSIDFKCLRFDREAMIGEWRFLFINSVSGASLSLLRRRHRSRNKRPSAATNRSCASSLKCLSPLRPLVRKIVRLTTYHKRRLESTTSELFIFLD